MPGIFLLDGEAEPFEAIEVFANRLSAFVGDFAFELGGDLLDRPVARVAAQQVADGGELGLRLGGPGLWLGGGGDRLGAVDEVGDRGLGGLGGGGLVVGPQPANVAVAFFGGAIGVEFHQPFQDLFIEAVGGFVVGGQGA